MSASGTHRCGGSCLPSIRQRYALVGALGALGLLVLLRIKVEDTLVLEESTHPTSEEWSWSVLPQTSRTLVARIKQELKGPQDGPYNLDNPGQHDYSQNGQSCFVAQLLGHESGPRTFVEAGAYDGENLSNSLYLERTLGWTGLLVEPDPWNFWSLQKRKRKALSLNACLAPNTYASKQKFRQSDTMSRLAQSGEASKGRGIFSTVVCYPLYSVLLAANATALDYLALDLEGLEMKVLETLPWEKVQITVLQVEASHLDPPLQQQPKPRKNKTHGNTLNRSARSTISDSDAYIDNNKNNTTSINTNIHNELVIETLSLNEEEEHRRHNINISNIINSHANRSGKLGDSEQQQWKTNNIRLNLKDDIRDITDKENSVLDRTTIPEGAISTDGLSDRVLHRINRDKNGDDLEDTRIGNTAMLPVTEVPNTASEEQWQDECRSSLARHHSNKKKHEFTNAQEKLIDFLRQKRYALITVIGEDFIFGREDLLKLKESDMIPVLTL